MRTVVCPRCSETIAMPDELTAGFCPRCAQALGPSETHLASGPPPALQAFQAEIPADDRKPASGDVAIELPERYASWENFRALSPAIQRELLKLAITPLPDLRMIGVSPLLEDAPAELDDWAKPLGTLSIPGESRLSVRLKGSIFVVAGVAMVITWMVPAAIFGVQNDRLDELVGFIGTGLIFNVFGVILVSLGIWNGWMRHSMFALTLWIFEEGLFLQRVGKSTVARFDQVNGFQTNRATGSPFFWITLEGEEPFFLSVGHCPEVMPLMEYVEIRMAAAQLIPRLKAIFDGKREQFGVVKLDKEGFHARGIVTPWSEVRRVICDDKSLFVDWTQRPDWVPIRYRDVSFPHLVMAISHVLIEEHSRLGGAAGAKRGDGDI